MTLFSSTCRSKKNVPQFSTRAVMLVGNPNCGKTTLFNALTGSRQHVGNWPGVTVSRQCGQCQLTETHLTAVTDLPGLYTLALTHQASSMDERIGCEYIFNHPTDLIVNVVDACHLERHLYLTVQLIEMGAPIILALNRMDNARANQLHIDTQRLSLELGCPVVMLEAHKGKGITDLKQAIALSDHVLAKPKTLSVYPKAVQQSIQTLSEAIVSQEILLTKIPAMLSATCLLEGNEYLEQLVPTFLLELAQQERMRIQQTVNEEADILIADARYTAISNILTNCVSKTATAKTTWTAHLDAIILNRVLGIPLFLTVMYLLFLFAINVGGMFQTYVDSASQAVLVDGMAKVLAHLHAPLWLSVMLAQGVGKGISTILTFIPVIGAMFFFLAFLEDSGYMARAAFVMDRLMRTLGLPGKAVVPMIVGFGCNVPAVMAARTLENKRDRILTIMMTPFMSCGGRLAIYSVFTAAFFPHGGQNIVFALYLIGILMAVFTGFVLQKTVLQGEAAPLMMELPTYHLPRIKALWQHTSHRLAGFVFNAGKLIVPICVLMSALNTLTIHGMVDVNQVNSHSLIANIGQWLTPIFAPMGIKMDNWPATVGLMTGILSKEVVVGTLNTLYAQMGSQLNTMHQTVYGMMYQQFDGQAGAFAYLLFVLLYFPCVSTIATMLREMHRGWSAFSLCWMTGIAYGTAVVFYQLATWHAHPTSSMWWVCMIVSLFLATLTVMRFIGESK